MTICKKCGGQLTGKQTSYCSERCSKLHLKSLYRKRKREQIAGYNREYRKRGMRPMKQKRKNKIIKDQGGECRRCKTTENLNVHHVVPLANGGDHSLLLVLCFKCHMKLEQMTKGFW